MRIRMTSLGLPAALLAASLFGACSNTAKGIQEDTAQNAAKAKEESAEMRAKAEAAGSEAKEAAGKAADATKNGIERAADATRDAAHDTAVATKGASEEAEQKAKSAASSTASALDAAQQTMQIKTALFADKSIDAGGINVDTDGGTKTVTLKGHVPTAVQKRAAERIAKSKAPDYKVVNDLIVR